MRSSELADEFIRLLLHAAQRHRTIAYWTLELSSSLFSNCLLFPASCPLSLFLLMLFLPRHPSPPPPPLSLSLLAQFTVTPLFMSASSVLCRPLRAAVIRGAPVNCHEGPAATAAPSNAAIDQTWTSCVLNSEHPRVCTLSQTTLWFQAPLII